jgi:hypothetical protein
VGVPAVVVGFSVLRVEFDGLIVVGDGAVVVALIGVGEPAVEVGFSILWVEFDGLVKVGDGAVVVAFVAAGACGSVGDGSVGEAGPAQNCPPRLEQRPQHHQVAYSAQQW